MKRGNPANRFELYRSILVWKRNRSETRTRASTECFQICQAKGSMAKVTEAENTSNLSGSCCYAILMTLYAIFLTIMWLVLAFGPLIAESIIIVHINRTTTDDLVRRWVPMGFSIFQSVVSILVALYLVDTTLNSLNNHPDYNNYNGSKSWRKGYCFCCGDGGSFRSVSSMTMLFLKSFFNVPIVVTSATLWWFTSLFGSSLFGSIGTVQGADWLVILCPVATFALAVVAGIFFKSVRRAQIDVVQNDV
jgi:hypothetical protein